MSRIPLALTAGIALLSLACGKASTPAAPELTHSPPGLPEALPLAAAALPTPSAGLGGLVARDGTLEGVSSLVRIHVDPTTLTATVDPTALRTGQATDDQYELDISIYFAPTDIKITGVTGTASTVDVSYVIAHPFAAPTSLTSPATAANRADLGISGRVLYLVDTPSVIGSTYFTGTDDVVVNSTLVENAAGYYKPNDLLDTSTFLANTFPFHALVNEAADLRLGVTNGGVEAGNYNPTTGWQGSNIGPTRTGWTGYGVLHQGQTVAQTVSLDRTSLGLGFSFDVAVLAKYTDPRGGTSGVQKRANRLPSSPADITKFVYRMPHGALDVERVVFISEGGGFLTNAISASALRFHVVDWDARATETSAADLSEDTTISTVPVGASGAPSLSVCIPGVLGDATTVVTLPPAALTNDDSAFGGDAGQDAGTPLDPLFYTSVVTKTVTSGQVSGTYTGLVRVEDVEADLASRIGWYFPLNGSVVPPLPLQGSDLLPEPVAYQAFTVQMTIPNVAPTATFSTPANVLSGTVVTHSVTVTSANDGDGNPITVEIDWDGGADNFVVAGTIVSPYAPLPTYTSPAGIWVNSTTTPASRTINVRFTDGIIPSPLDAPNLTTTLGANRAPQLTGTPNVALAATTINSNQSFTMNAGTVVTGSNVTDPEGDAITYRIYDNITPAAPKASGATFPIGSVGPYVYPTTPSVQFTTYATDALHPDSATGTALAPTLAGTVIGGDVLTIGAAGSQILDMKVTVDAAGNSYVAGSFTGTVDFDPGAGVVNRTAVGGYDGFCAKYSPLFGYLWVSTWGGTSSERANDIDIVLGESAVAILGNFTSPSVDFDPGVGTANRFLSGTQNSYLLFLTSAAGAYQNVHHWTSTGVISWNALHIEPSAAGNIIVGEFSGTADLNQEAGTLNRVSAGGTDICWILLSSGFSFVSGMSLGSSGTDFATSGVRLADGSFAITGNFAGTFDFDWGAGTANRFSVGGQDIFLLRGSNLNNYMNAVTMGSTSNDVAMVVAGNASFGVVAGGTFAGSMDFDPGAGVATRVPVAGSDAFVARYTTALAYTWASTFGGAGTDGLFDLRLTPGDSVRVAGYFQSTVDFDPGVGVVTKTAVGVDDACLLSLSSAGAYEYVSAWGGTGSDRPQHLAITSTGYNRVAGNFFSPSVDFNPGAGVVTRNRLGSVDGFVLQLLDNGSF